MRPICREGRGIIPSFFFVYWCLPLFIFRKIWFGFAPTPLRGIGAIQAKAPDICIYSHVCLTPFGNA